MKQILVKSFSIIIILAILSSCMPTSEASITDANQSASVAATATATDIITPTHTEAVASTNTPEPSATPFITPTLNPVRPTVNPVRSDNVPCFSYATWNSLYFSEPAPLPDELPDKVLVLFENELVIQDLTTGEKRFIDYATSADISPDGQYIIYSKERGPVKDIILYNIRFDVKKNFMINNYYERITSGAITPVFSPDGKVIAFGVQRVEGNSNHIYVLPITGVLLSPFAEIGNAYLIQWAKHEKDLSVNLGMGPEYIQPITMNGENLGAIVYYGGYRQEVSDDETWLMKMFRHQNTESDIYRISFNSEVTEIIRNSSSEEFLLSEEYLFFIRNINDFFVYPVNFINGTHWYSFQVKHKLNCLENSKDSCKPILTPILANAETCEVIRIPDVQGEILGFINGSSSDNCPVNWSQLSTGMSASVKIVDGDLLANPDKNAQVISQLAQDTIIKIMAGPVCAEGLIYWQVSYTTETDVKDGWMLEGDGANYYIEPHFESTKCSLGWSQLKVGMHAVIVGDERNNVRLFPSKSSQPIAKLSPGMTMKILEGPVCADGLVFWRFATSTIDNYTIGWTAEGDGETYFLEPFDQTAYCQPGFSRLKPGMEAIVLGDSSNKVRSAPKQDAEVIGNLPPNTLVRILEGPRCHNGMYYWKVSNNDVPGGIEGWTAEGDGVEYYLAPVE